MTNLSYFMMYWVVCLVFWWILTGKQLSRRFAFLADRDAHYEYVRKHAGGAAAEEERRGDLVERRTVALLSIVDILTAPLFVPIELIRRAVNGLYTHYVNIK